MRFTTSLKMQAAVALFATHNEIPSSFEHEVTLIICVVNAYISKMVAQGTAIKQRNFSCSAAFVLVQDAEPDHEQLVEVCAQVFFLYAQRCVPT
jgi:hypothetical protein